MRDSERLAHTFKTLSVETRVRIVQLLKQRSLCVNALARELAISAAAVSQHLRVLRDAGVVSAERHGNSLHYSVNAKKLAQCRDRADRLLSPCPKEGQRSPSKNCPKHKRKE